MSETLLPKGARTRRAILDRATALATERGLESLSIGGLAEELGMSKSGLFSHFGSKEELQIATVERAAAVFTEEVIVPAREAPKGVARVWALCDHMLAYMEREVFPGGCFFATVSFEYKRRPGPVRDRVAETLERWLSYLAHAIEQAQELGEIAFDVDPRSLAFRLDAFAAAANAHYQLFGDASAFGHARAGVRELLESSKPR
jgi:AcrR family transcriptional regulator